MKYIKSEEKDWKEARDVDCEGMLPCFLHVLPPFLPQPVMTNIRQATSDSLHSMIELNLNVSLHASQTLLINCSGPSFLESMMRQLYVLQDDNKSNMHSRNAI